MTTVAIILNSYFTFIAVVKKVKKDKKVKEVDGDAAAADTDFMIQPEQVTPRIDTSK